MSFLDSVSRASAAVAGRLQEQGILAPIQPIIRPFKVFTPPRPTNRSLLQMYQTSPWVHANVSKVAHSVGKTRWYLQVGDDKVEEHPALVFLNGGSEYLTGQQSRTVTAAHLDLTGEAFWLIGRDGTGNPASFFPCPPNWILDVALNDKEQWRLQPERGVQVWVDFADMIWFKHVDPLDPTSRGSGMARSMSDELAIDASVRTYLLSYLKNDARPGIIISGAASGSISPDETKRLEASWLPKFKGERNAGKPLFTSAPLSVHEFGFSPRESQMAELSDRERKTLTELWGIPPEIFGRVESSNRATIDGAEDLMGRFVLTPRLELLRDILQIRLLWEFEDLPDNARLMFESPVPADIKHSLDTMKAAPAAFKYNEWRATRGLPPLDGDLVDRGEELYEPLMVKATGEVPLEDGSPEPGSTPPAPAGKKPAGKKPAAGDKPGKNGKKPKGGKPGKAGKKSVDDPADYDLADVVAISTAHDANKERDKANKLLAAGILTMMRELGELDSEQFVLNLAAQAWVRLNARKTLRQIDETTRDMIRNEVIDLMQQGATRAQIEAAVKELFASFNTARVALIARTTATNVAGYTALIAMAIDGVTHKRWKTNLDGRERDTHHGLDGQTVALGENFKSASGATAPHPGAFGVADEDINCRCTVEPGSEQRTATYADVERTAATFAETVKTIFALQEKAVLAALKR